MNLRKIKKIHFIGIGGIGLSGLARLLLAQDKIITGSDLSASSITQDLVKNGAKIFIGPHQARNLPADSKLVIKSLAVRDDNLELLAAKKLSLTILTYPEALAQFIAAKFSIAISGMHGKSTTTAMIGLMLENCNLDPSVLVGSRLKEWNSNVRLGQSNYFVFEADEYDKAMLNYAPRIIVLTRLEPEHLDTYRDLDDILDVFGQYIAKLPVEGVLIANCEDENIIKILDQTKARVVTYGLKKGELRPEGIQETPAVTRFKLAGVDFALRVPGLHNIANALAAIAVGLNLGLELKDLAQSLGRYRGIWRRFEKLGEFQGAKVISDYAHHPTEVRATLEAARTCFPDKRIVLAYQPHQRQRTKRLFHEFVTCFQGADLLFLNEIFEVAGREKAEDQLISSQDLVDRIKERGQKVYYSANLEQTEKLIRQQIGAGDVLIIMGAGDIYKIAEKIV